MTTFISQADSRETSNEIINAIFRIARDDESTAARVWEEPTNEELIAIWEIVTGNGRNEASDFYWGASGNKWASGMGVE